MWGGALVGSLLRRVLPKHHLSEESKYIVGLGTGLLATLAALVLGLLIASAKTSFDQKTGEIKQGAAKIILLDRNLRYYGPETSMARTELRQLTVARHAINWLEAGATPATGQSGAPGIEDVQEKIVALVPTDDAQRWRRARALELSSELTQMRWLVIDERGGTIPSPFLIALVLWLTVIFTSLGLFAPGHGTAYAVILACALSAASAIFLILSLDQPFAGLIRISDAPLREALAIIDRP